MLRHLRFAALALLLGCHVTPAATLPTGASEPAAPRSDADEVRELGRAPTVTTPACTASIDASGEVLVDGKPTGLQTEMPEYTRVRSFAWDDRSILLAVGRALPYLPFFGEDLRSDILWRVSCTQPSERSVEIQIDDADLSWAALAPDRSALYFSRPGDGVQRLDFAARDFGPIAPPPPIDQCWMAEQPTPAQEYVEAWIGDDALLVIQGGPCSFEAEFAGRLIAIEDPGGQARRRDAAFVGAVELDARERIWVGDGGLCSDAATVWSRGTPSVWRSDDAGANFVELPIRIGSGAQAIDSGVEFIWTASDNPDHVLVRTACCYESAADTCSGGRLLRSDDGGRSWIEVSPIGWFAQQGLRVSADLRELELALQDIETDRALTLRSRDGGRRWAEGPARDIDDPPAQRRVELDGVMFEASDDGLTRRATDAAESAAVVVFRPQP